MELRTYYRISLLFVPFVLAISYLVIWPNPAFWVVAFAGPQYIIFCLLAYIVIGKIKSDQHLLVVLYCAPLLFVPIEFIGEALIFGSGDEHIPFKAAQTFFELAKIVILIGYPVVLFVDLLRVIAQWAGLVKSFQF